MSPIRRKITDDDLKAAARLRLVWDAKKDSLGLNQETAGDAIGVSQSAFSQYLRGKAAIGFEAAVRLAALLKVHVSAIRPEIADVVDQAAGGMRLDEIIWQLPVESQQLQLDLLSYNLERAEGFIATDKMTSYVKFIAELKRDMDARRREPPNEELPPE